MRKGFKNKPINETEKIYIGIKLPFNQVEKMSKYHKKCERSKFIQEAIIEKMANIDAQKEIQKMGM